MVDDRMVVAGEEENDRWDGGGGETTRGVPVVC
jgi:hypothetical protein